MVLLCSSIARSHSLRSSISDSQSNHPSLFLTLSVPPFNFSVRIIPPFEAFNLILRICQKKLSKELAILLRVVAAKSMRTNSFPRRTGSL
ncbi:hypothetical protein P8452_74152 [Trifolium repens]|nr:hypothetical protein P8452_74152 [Trifolium repens]